MIRRSLAATLASLLLVAALAPVAAAATQPAPLARAVKFGKFSSPTQVVQPPGSNDVIWVVQQGGRIAVVRGGKISPVSALDIRSKVSTGGEQGLLSVAFAPDFTTSRRVYVTYTNRSNSIVLAEYRGTESTLDPASRRLVLVLPKPQPNHNGGTIRFGKDGYLYLGLGDGGCCYDSHGTIGNAQDLTSPFGKMLRIDPRASRDRPYTVPVDNPFNSPQHAAAGVRPEIWAYGMRNPWKWSFAPDGALWIGDVGELAVEEITRVAAPGANLGWRIMEGTRLREGTTKPAGLADPIHTYRHGDLTGCAVIGGHFVADRSLTKLVGKYIHGDFCQPTLRWISTDRNGVVTGKGSASIRFETSIVSIDEDLSGRVYISIRSGNVWRLAR